MTRINVDLSPALLTDQHLFAEYREMRRIPTSLLKSLSGKSPETVMAAIPAQFCLGPGHVKFFYNKGNFLTTRYSLLRQALLKRGYQLNDDGVFDRLAVYQQHPVFLGDRQYRFNSAARSLIVERIMQRIGDKPRFYTLLKEPIEIEHYYKLLQSGLFQS